MSFGFGFALPHWQTLSGGFSPASLFSAGEQGAWYDPSDASTLFSDTAGTTPSPTPGAGALSVVGLMLDKSQGLVLSANVLSASWTVSAGATASGSSVTLNSASDVFAYQDVMTSGLRYFVTFDYNITSGQTGLYVGSNGGSGDAILSLSGLSGTGTYSGYFRASNTTFIFRDNSGCVASFTNITLRVQQGNHAISYNTTTARPELSARVNLLTYSEQFDNAAWSRDGVTISANTLATTDPLGGNTADKIEEQITSAAHVVYTSGISASAIQYNISVYVKAAERTFARLDCVTTGYTAGTTVILNLNTLATTITNYGATSGTTAQVVTVGNGWYRLVVTFTATAASYFAQIGPAIASTPSTYAGTAGSGIYAWGADLRPANIGSSAPSYQRIADQYTYDSSGFPRYLVFNGTASGMYTPASIPFATVTSDGQARRNLLNNPTQFDVTASWTQTAVTVTANTAVAPDGTTSGDTIQLGAGTSIKWIGQSASAFAGARTYSFYAKYSTNRYIQFLNNGSAQAWANFDILNGVAGTAGSGVTSSITDAGNGWWRCVITHSIAAATEFRVYGADSNSAAWDASTTSTGAYFLWGAQLETGSTATAFQNIGTDKATVFAGVRKLDNTNALQLVELSTAVGSNVGAFSMPTNDISAGRWATYLSGSTGLVSASAAGTTAPITTVNAGLYDIALSADEARLRINGAQVATSGASNAGTGNFGTYPLYIGSRNNAGLYFNGYIYSLIVVGAASTAAQISSTESWINSKEGTVFSPPAPAAQFAVLPSSGSPTYTVTRTVLDSAGTSYSVPGTVLDSTGTSYAPI